MADRIVVGAAIVRAGSVLAARRSRPVELRGKWEFPGGKVEPGESDAAALVRECREELSIEVSVGTLLATSQVRRGLQLRVYLAALAAGSAEPAAGADHGQLRWLRAGELTSVPWLEPDRAAVTRLADILPAGSG